MKATIVKFNADVTPHAKGDVVTLTDLQKEAVDKRAEMFNIGEPYEVVKSTEVKEDDPAVDHDTTVTLKGVDLPASVPAEVTPAIVEKESGVQPTIVEADAKEIATAKVVEAPADATIVGAKEEAPAKKTDKK